MLDYEYILLVYLCMKMLSVCMFVFPERLKWVTNLAVSGISFIFCINHEYCMFIHNFFFSSLSY